MSVAQSRLRFSDLLSDALSTIRSNRLRYALSAVAVLLGAATSIAVATISLTTSAQVGEEFDALRATLLMGKATEELPGDGVVFPADADLRLAGVRGVESGGVWAEAGKVKASTTGVGTELEVELIGADAGALRASGVDVNAFLAAAFTSNSDSALVGSALAEELGISATGSFPRIILVGSRIVTLLGVIPPGGLVPELDDALIMPRAVVMERHAPPPEAQNLVVEVSSGSAKVVGAAIPAVLAPTRKDPYRITYPPDPEAFRLRVERSIQVLVLAMAALSMIVGAISIAGTMFNAVRERRGEFGLRRTLGARPVHLRAHVVTEAVLVTSVSGVAGVLVGLLVAVTYAGSRDWVTVVDPRLLLGIPVGCALVGIVSGWFPAVTAGRIDPADALRSE